MVVAAPFSLMEPVVKITPAYSPNNNQQEPVWDPDPGSTNCTQARDIRQALLDLLIIDYSPHSLYCTILSVLSPPFGERYRFGAITLPLSSRHIAAPAARTNEYHAPGTHRAVKEHGLLIFLGQRSADARAWKRPRREQRGRQRQRR